jgi:glycosyltransferase involved in cell wall biosynthesis
MKALEGTSDAKLLLAGAPILGPFDMELPESVRKVGWVRPEDIDRLYQSADAVVMPSRWEGFGLVAVEAMRNAVPVIGSNRGAIPEIVRHGETGIIFDLDAPGELTRVLGSLTRADLRRMGANARRDYDLKFTSSRMAESLDELYRKVASETGPLPDGATRNA